MVRGSARRVLSATSAAPSDLGRRVAMLAAAASGGAGAAVGHRCLCEVHGWGDRVYEAVRRLLRERPTDSAGRRTPTGRSQAAAGAVGVTIGAVFVVPAATIAPH